MPDDANDATSYDTYGDAPLSPADALAAPPTSGTRSEPGVTLLVRGTLRGPALDELGETLEAAMSSPHALVRLDVSGVDDWSALAQAMVLHTARIVDRRGSRLVLRGASRALRLRSRWLEVFDQIDSEP
jgi:hypothetical protein